MPAKRKITLENEQVIRELCSKGYNATYIGKSVGLSKDTVKAWANKNGFILNKKRRTKFINLESDIIKLLKERKTRKQIQRTLNVHYTQVTDVAIKHNLTNLLRTRQVAALEDKILSDKEVELKITDKSEYIGYSKTKKKYGFKCATTGKIFYKTSGKIWQGSPYGKSGYVVTESDYIERLRLINHTLKKGTFTKIKSPVTVYCSRGHERNLAKASYALKFGCSLCNNSCVSQAEIELLNWIKEYYPSAHKYKFETRITKPKEIDIFIPELRLGIEYCGLYFHAENNLEESEDNKHYKKMLLANSLGIRLITIFENEWIERKEQVKNFLLSVIKKNIVKVSARKCEISLISREQSAHFMDKNHIQGAEENSLVSFGLFYNDTLVGAISCGRHPQKPGIDRCALYLNRLAFLGGTTVAGGASRLLSAVVRWAKEKGYNKVISWSDNRWSEGNIYKKLGFEFDSQQKRGRGLSDGSIWPDFRYAVGGKLYTRNKVKSLGLEEENLNKIYDCGKKRWIINFS